MAHRPLTGLIQSTPFSSHETKLCGRCFLSDTLFAHEFTHQCHNPLRLHRRLALFRGA